MDENKELGNQQSQPDGQAETYIAASEENTASEAPAQEVPAENPQPALPTPPQFNGEGGPTPEITAKKVNTGFIALAVLAGILVIAIVVVIAMGAFGQKPEKAVREAFALTGEKMQALSDQLMEDIPLYQMFLPKAEGRVSHFKISPDSLEVPNLGSGTQGIFSGLMKMFSISGDIIKDPSAELAELNAGIDISDVPIIGFHMQATPDQVSFNVPALSDKVLSVNPNTFAEDYKNSPFYLPGINDQTLQELQDTFTMQLASLTSMGGIDVQAMQDEMYAIMDGVFVDATYDKPLNQGGAKVYPVHLDDRQVSQTIVALLRYIYIDSDLGKMYSENMREILERDIIAPFEAIPAEGSTFTMNVTVGKNGLISQVDIFEDVAGGAENGENAFQITYRISEDFTVISMDVNLTKMEMNDNNSGTVNMNVTADYTDGNCKADMTAAFDLVAESIPVKFDMTFDMNLDKEGNVDMGMGMNMYERPEAGIPAAKMDFALKGTYTVDENGVAAWDFPTLKFGMDMAELGGYNAMNFNLSGESKPLEEPVQPDTDTTPLLTMTPEELTAEMQKYQEGLSSLMEETFGFPLTTGEYDDPDMQKLPPNMVDPSDFMDPAA